MSLNEIQEGNHGFDQFKNKKSTYDENLYSTSLDETKLTSEQKKLATKQAHEIEN